jgi:hypothetical protein
VIGARGAAFGIILPHVRHSRQTHPVAVRSFGMRTRLYAAAVRTKNHSTSSRPRCRVLRRPPKVLIQLLHGHQLGAIELHDRISQLGPAIDQAVHIVNLTARLACASDGRSEARA